MANHKKFSVFLRVLAGAISFAIGLVLLYGVFVSRRAGLDFGTFSQVFACAWLGFVAIAGIDAVSYAVSASDGKSES